MLLLSSSVASLFVRSVILLSNCAGFIIAYTLLCRAALIFLPLHNENCSFRAGMVGRAIALDLANEHSVTSFDLNAANLEELKKEIH